MEKLIFFALTLIFSGLLIKPYQSSCVCTGGKCDTVCSSYGKNGSHCYNNNACIETCSCDMTLHRCSSGCGTSDGWCTAGSNCSTNSDCQQQCWNDGANCLQGCASWGMAGAHAYNLQACTQQCFCDLANSRCSNGCGQSDGWYTAGAFCKKDKDCQMQCSLIDNRCSVGCVAYGTYQTYQYNIDGCQKKCDCDTSSHICNSYCGSISGGWIKANKNCSHKSDCNFCDCNLNGTCTSGCSQFGKNGTSCNSVADCVISLVTPIVASAGATINFSLNSANNTQLLNVLSIQTGDMSGCLVNCSSNGQCKFDYFTQMYECGCNSFFSGQACQFDSRPCSSSPCLNNGTCINANNDTSFKCVCQNTFFGLNCENQINICQNITCGRKGYCFNDQNEPKCKCFTGYSGDNCELVSSQVKIAKNVQITSSIICFIVLSTTVALVVLNDLWNCFFTGKKDKKIVKSNDRSKLQRLEDNNKTRNKRSQNGQRNGKTIIEGESKGCKKFK